MKKKLLFFMVIAMTMICLVSYNERTCPSATKVGEFNVEDYQCYISQFPSKEVLGSVTTVQSAKKNAEQIWAEIYGDNIKKNKPYQVFYDSEHEVWLVQGDLPKNYLGGVPYILIEEKTGKVLAVWHDK